MDGSWLYKMVGYGYKGRGLPTLADDRTWDQEGWGKRVADGFFHYYPPYYNRAVCRTTQVKPDRLDLFVITRPLELYSGSELPRYAIFCSMCRNIKRRKDIDSVGIG